MKSIIKIKRQFIDFNFVFETMEHKRLQNGAKKVENHNRTNYSKITYLLFISKSKNLTLFDFLLLLRT